MTKNHICIFLFITFVIVNISYARDNINIIEKTNLSLNHDYQRAKRLVPYYKFPEYFKNYGKKISREELSRQIKEAILNTKSTMVDLGFSELKKIILECLNIEFLLEDINSRSLMVTTIEETDHGEYIEKKLLFEDKVIGIFDVLILIPKQISKQLPAIIGLHGHGESSVDFRDKYGGIEFVQNGFIVIMPSFRAMNGDKEEFKLSEMLMLEGFTLMGIRVYEVLLLVKYLINHDNVDNSRIGVIGHSGGGSVANLVFRISDFIKVKFSDKPADSLKGWVDRIENLEPYPASSIHCETVPCLSYYREAIEKDNCTDIIGCLELDR